MKFLGKVEQSSTVILAKFQLDWIIKSQVMNF